MGAVGVSKIYETLSYLEKVAKNSIIPTDVNYNQFERNVYNAWLGERYEMVLQNLHIFTLAVGKPVWSFASPERIGYSFEYRTDVVNRTLNYTVPFTQEMYDKYEVDYLNFIIDHHVDYLMSNTPIHRSTNSLANYCKLLEVEAAQEFIKELKRLAK